MPLASRLSLYAAIAACIASFAVGLHNPTPLRWEVYPYSMFPILFTLIPYQWRTRWAVIVAAALLCIYLIAPWSFSIGIFYWPAAIFMIVASFRPVRETQPRVGPA